MSIPSLPSEDLPDLRDDLPDPPQPPTPPASVSALQRDIAHLLHLSHAQQDTIDALSQRHEQHGKLLKDLAEPLNLVLSEAAETAQIVQQQIAEIDEKMIRAEDAVGALIDLRDEFAQMMAELRELHRPEQHRHAS